MTKNSQPTYHRDTDPLNMRAAPADEEAKLELRHNLLRLSTNQLTARLHRLLAERNIPRPTQDKYPIIQRVLDTTAGTSGNILPRVDLEQTVLVA